MRRKDREITDLNQLKQLLGRYEVCRLSMFDGDYPYTVPFNFGFTWEGDLPVIYLHCAMTGKKIDLLATHNKVCLEWDGDHKLLPDADPSECSYAYSSLIGQGEAVLLTDYEEKLTGLSVLLGQYGYQEFNLPADLVQRTGVICVKLENLTGKAKIS